MKSFSPLLLTVSLFCYAEVTVDMMVDLLHVPRDVARRIIKKIKIARYHTESLPGFGSYYPILPRFINERGYTVGCEVGVFLGGHIESIMANTAVEKLYAIDPYILYGDVGVVRGFTRGIKKRYWPACFDGVFYYVKDRLAVFGDRVEMIRNTSDKVAKTIPDNSLDFVFIDGDHSYAAVLQDVANYYDKVRSGGIISGDDYIFAEVGKAVDEFFGQKGLQVNQDETQKRFWWIEKP